MAIKFAREQASSEQWPGGRCGGDVHDQLRLQSAGSSRLFTGEFIRKTGPSRDSDFLYGAIQYTF
jgi:hypothetical protein